MIYERLRLMRDLLADDGSLYVHCDWRVNSYIRAIIDDVFGSKHFRAGICWKSSPGHSDAAYYSEMQDTILFATKGDRAIWNQQYQKYEDSYLDQHYQKREPNGRRFEDDNLTGYGLQGGGYTYPWKGVTKLWRCPISTMERLEQENKLYYTKNGVPRIKRYLDEMPGVPVSDLWQDIPRVNSQALEKTGYDTQKPEPPLDRIIRASSKEGDLVADFFCGSGTTLAVAEKLGRKWIGCDLGRFAIHTSRKRLIGVQREARKQGAPYRSFEILNLGKYERMYFLGIDPNLPEPERHAQSIRREEHYLNLILSAYKAERTFQAPPFHGKKNRTWVVVGPIDAPVTHAQFLEVVAACRKQQVSSVDVLGFEFEMGLHPNLTDDARKQGVNVALRYIPKDVFDKRAVEAGQVQFYDLAYVEVKTQAQGLTARVTLADFSVYYRQEDVDALGGKLKPGGSKVTVANGQVLKLSKDKSGIVHQEILTKLWTDWVDYWAVDFDFESRAEVLTEVVDGLEVRRTTGNFLFENEWQSFRTRKDRALELTSAGHTYPKKGKYKVAVKVIDIFGNDTTKVVGVTI